MITLAALSVAYADGRRALDDLDLSIAPGERVALIGPSGAGKTTLLRVIGASLRPTAGQLQLDGVDPWALGSGPLQALRARIGKMHQAPPIPPRQRVITAVLAGRLGQWPLWRAVASLVYPLDIAGTRAVLEPLGLAERLFDRCDQLSGGQLQRVALARLFYQKPEIVLADEPVSALDPALARSVAVALNEDAKRRDVTLIASLHAVDLALSEFSRVIGLREGRIVFDRPAAQVLTADIDALYAGASHAAAHDTPDQHVPSAKPRLTRCA
ncbi:phosphonate ABC transporter ATP-binding protein [Denitromonas halophila]|uniref:Phosphonate ABC transporter ATP-binding protein n=1 Tax=Denitromonas halophila TaxID=1629404 RepID=A0A557QZB1_9RHOO|nr:phosphonate ABC transporter ATP-binding protein [Denitromonas halophila]TVO58247.1 phosphonate ABC transporter ATP-binding protein [Denitromonas halophila]